MDLRNLTAKPLFVHGPDILLQPGETRTVADKWIQHPDIHDQVIANKLEASNYIRELASRVVDSELTDYALGTTRTESFSLSFSGETEKTFELTLAADLTLVILSRFYIATDPGAPYSGEAEVTFYQKNTYQGPDATFRAVVKLVYTELKTATTGTNNLVAVDDESDFVEHGLLWIHGTPGEFARVQVVADPMQMEDNVTGVFPIDTGVSRVPEFGAFIYVDSLSNKSLYMRIKFDVPTTLNLKADFVMRV